MWEQQQQQQQQQLCQVPWCETTHGALEKKEKETVHQTNKESSTPGIEPSTS